MTIQPIRQTMQVKAPPDRAFDLFANRIADWWPTGFGIGKEPLVAVFVEPRVGGRWYERDAAGVETQWGRVLAWEPPRRLLLGWQVNSTFAFDPDLLTEVELTFADAPGGGSIVTLEHRDLEKFGAEAEQMATSLGGGWTSRLADYVAYANQQ